MKKPASRLRQLDTIRFDLVAPAPPTPARPRYRRARRAPASPPAPAAPPTGPAPTSSLRLTFAYVSESSSPTPSARSCSGNSMAAAPAAAVANRRPSSFSSSRRARSCAKNPNIASTTTVGAIVPTSSRAKSRRRGRTNIPPFCRPKRAATTIAPAPSPTRPVLFAGTPNLPREARLRRAGPPPNRGWAGGRGETPPAQRSVAERYRLLNWNRARAPR